MLKIAVRTHWVAISDILDIQCKLFKYENLLNFRLKETTTFSRFNFGICRIFTIRHLLYRDEALSFKQGVIYNEAHGLGLLSAVSRSLTRFNILRL